VFLSGWARKASEGLVGIAKRDGDWCAEVVSRYLSTKSPGNYSDVKVVLDKLASVLTAHQSHPVDLEGLRILELREKSHWGEDCIGEFKYANNQEMLELIEGGNS
jgi:ferredoxin--NADP+ reductase